MKLYRKTLQQTSGHWHALSAILLLELLSIPLALLAPVGIKIAIDSVISGKPVPQMIQNIFPAHFMSAPGNVLMLAVALQFLVVLLIQARSFCSYLMKLRCGERMVLGLRSRMFRHLLALPLTFHDNRGSTDSSLRIGDDAGAIRSITIDNSLFLISDIVKLLGVGCVTFFIDWRLALLALSIAPFLVIYAFFYNRWVGDRYKAVRKLESAAQQIIQEVLSSLRIVKAFAQETSEEKRFVTQAQESEAARIQLAFADATFGLVVNLTTGAGMAMVLYMGIRNVQMGIVTLGSLLIVITYLAQLYAPLQNITYHMASFKASSASVERALEIFEARPEESLTQASSEKSASRTTGTIEFHNVTFAHRANLPILEDFNLTVPGGAKIGLVGKTGAGKTTLVNLLVRFLDPHSGHIRLDGRDLREYSLPELRHQFAMVLQEPVLFSTTIAKNIAYGRPEATRVEIIEASILANAHHFIQKLPMGYDTHVGERGILLSGGERQRVSIARAFLKDAPILVLDEPTSSLDIKTESEILDSMERLVSGRTTFLISHRLQALSNCDFVLKLEQGKPPDMLRVHSINELESLLQSPRLRPDEVAVA